MPTSQQPLISKFTRTWSRRKVHHQDVQVSWKIGKKRSIGYKRQKDEVTPHHPILNLLVYVWCNKIYNRNDRIKETRQEYPKQSLYPTIRQPNTFIPWHHIRHIIEMASEDFLIRLSVVFKKFGLIANEFLSVICQFLNVGIQGYILVDDIQTVLSNLLRKLKRKERLATLL